MSAVDYYGDELKGLEDGAAEAAAAAANAARSELTADGAKLVLVMVGLPARGKSFISGKLKAFLNWSGYRTEIFNAGQKRRKGDEEDWAVSPVSSGDQSSYVERAKNSASEFYDPLNQSAKQKREQIAMDTLETLLEWLCDEGDIAIFDATNSDPGRRRAVVDRITQQKIPPRSRPLSGLSEVIRVVFIESVCDNPAVLEANMLLKVRNSPDFKGMPEAEALADFRQRIANYERSYESVNDDEGAYIKVFNLSCKVTAHQVYGRMSRSVLPYMMAIHNIHRSVFLVALCPRDGEQDFGRRKKKGLGKGGGKGYKRTLSDVDSDQVGHLMPWIKERFVGRALQHLCVLASTKPPAVRAAEHLRTIGVQTMHQSSLNPLDRGTSRVPVDHDDRCMAFTQRFPGGGESYQDLVRRLEPSLLDIERSVDPVLVISHVGPARALRAYFLGLDVASTMLVPTKDDGASALANRSNALVELRPKHGGGWQEVVHYLEPKSPVEQAAAEPAPSLAPKWAQTECKLPMAATSSGDLQGQSSSLTLSTDAGSVGGHDGETVSSGSSGADLWSLVDA